MFKIVSSISTKNQRRGRSKLHKTQKTSYQDSDKKFESHSYSSMTSKEAFMISRDCKTDWNHWKKTLVGMKRIFRPKLASLILKIFLTSLNQKWSQARLKSLTRVVCSNRMGWWIRQFWKRFWKGWMISIRRRII